MIKVGRVVKTEDYQGAGIITIDPLDSNASPGKRTIQALPCGQNLGGGAGFFSVPGPGNTVLYVEMPPAQIPGVPIPITHAWIGCIPTIMEETKGRSPVSSDKNDADESNTSQKDPTPRPQRTHRVVSTGVPESENAYADNHIPQQDIWKQKNGHKIVMSHKITQQGTHDNSITFQAASGKMLKIDDGPPELAMDRITLQDEKTNEQGSNRISIITASKSPGEDQSIELISERDQRFFTNKGNQYHLIYKGKGSMYRENKGSGNIEDIVYKGSHKTTAEKNITRVAAKGSIIEQATKGDINYTAKEGSIAIEAAQEISLTVGGSTVVIDNTGVTITAPTINLVGPVVVSSGTTTLSTGVVLDTHTHPGVKSGTSSTFGPQ